MQNRIPSFIKNSGAKKGFTLIELIVGITLGVLLIGMITTVFVYGLRHIQKIERDQVLHSNAMFILNTITYWVKQGKELDDFTPGTLNIILPDSTTKKIAKNGNSIKIDDGEPITPSNIKITDLNFIKMAHSVRVNLAIKVANSEETFTTTIAQRNN